MQFISVTKFKFQLARSSCSNSLYKQIPIRGISYFSNLFFFFRNEASLPKNKAKSVFSFHWFLHFKLQYTYNSTEFHYIRCFFFKLSRGILLLGALDYSFRHFCICENKYTDHYYSRTKTSILVLIPHQIS